MNELHSLFAAIESLAVSDQTHPTILKFVRSEPRSLSRGASSHLKVEDVPF